MILNESKKKTTHKQQKTEPFPLMARVKARFAITFLSESERE